MTLKIRLSPSGPEIGDPPAQVGNSSVAGRVWGKSGTDSSSANVPGTAVGDVTGSIAQVDLKASASGYRYDVEGDATTFGTGGDYKVIVVGSSDGGATYPHTLAASADFMHFSGSGRVHLWGVAMPADIDHVKMQLQAQFAASTALTYVGDHCTWRITEISPTS